MGLNNTFVRVFKLAMGRKDLACFKYKDSRSNFEELLTKANRVSIHHKNLQLLAPENFKTQKNLSPRLMNQIFVENLHTPFVVAEIF